MNRNLRESLAGGRNSPAISQHRRGKSLNGISRDSDENLDLFSRSRRSLPLSSSNEPSDVSAKLGRLSVGSIKLPKSGADDLLASSTDGGKHDYDWLLTPPGTPLGTESHPPMAAPRTSSVVRSVSTTNTSRLSVSHSESHHTSRPTRSSSVTRPSVSNSHYIAYSSNRTPSSVLNTSSASVSSYIRPSSPSTRSSSSSTRHSTPSRATTVSRPSTPSRTRSGSTTSTLDRTKPAHNSRPSTPTSRPQHSSATVSRSNSRSSTPTRRSPVVHSMSAASVPNSMPGRAVSNGRTTAPLSRPSSPGPRVKQPQQPTVLLDFPHDTPTNLRTTLPDRPVSAGRSRPGAAAGIKSSPDPKSSVNLPRRNPSPITTRGRLTDGPGRGRASGNGHLIDGPDSQKVSNVSDLTSRRPLKPSIGLSESAGLGRSISKNSLDMALRHMDIRNGKGSSRTLSSTTVFPQSIRTAASKIQVIRPLSRSDSVNSNGSLQSGDMSENRNGADNGRFLAKLSDVDVYESSRYDALLLKEDVKNTNWLHCIDDKSDQSLLFDNGFESLPEPFAPQ